MKYLDRQVEALFSKAKAPLKPLFWLRDAARVNRIQSAPSIRALIDLSPQATSLAEEAWRERLRGFGAAALPPLVEMLKQLRLVEDAETRRCLEGLFISELRWQEHAGARALLECFDDLYDYGLSLACVVLGLLKAESAVECIWNFYRQAQANSQEPDSVGALWGLIDLGDDHAAEALNGFVRDSFHFFELFGFLALAGDLKSLIPLLERAEAASPEERYDPLLAVVAIAHRSGWQAALAELQRSGLQDGEDAAASEIVDQLLAIPLRNVEEHFALFYRGFTPQDVSNAFTNL